MLRKQTSEKPSAVLLWQDESGYAPIYLSKMRVALVLFALVATSLWAITATSYLLFKDDVLVSLATKHSERTYAYEDRLAKMRAQTDRITSKQLIDQDLFERKMAIVVEKQQTLSGQQQIMADLSKRTGLIEQLNLVKAGLESAENMQIAQLKSTEKALKSKNDVYNRIFAALNLPQPSMPAIGGPFIPSHLKTSEIFTTALMGIEQLALKNIALKSEVEKLPLARPLPHSHEMTSNFGTRLDPFTRSYALHSGIDFRGATGDPVRATASGIVVTAGVQGGYGNLVEIEHGHDFATRYAHLSQLNVREGEQVKLGQIIGYIGSTGRSTGAHLHYEIRKNDAAQDPANMLRLNQGF
jgi:murein DD-endopeptidase MepM/ murein hydrolase activator NlpD